MNKEEITLNGKVYVEKNSVNIQSYEFTGEETVASILIGKRGIVRTRNAGLLVGTVELADDTGIVLTNARRIWYHRPKNKELAWYEGVVVSGLSEDSKISCTMTRRVCIEDYEFVEIENATIFDSIMEKEPHEQN